MLRNCGKLTNLTFCHRSSLLCFSKSLTPSVLTSSLINPNTFTTTLRNTTRCYSSISQLKSDDTRKRLLDLLKGYDKVPENYELKDETDFSRDLGLDSLDVVEVTMAVEEEFSIGISEEVSDTIRTFKDVFDIIAKDPNSS